MLLFDQSDSASRKLYLILIDRQQQYSSEVNFIEKISSGELLQTVLGQDGQSLEPKSGGLLTAPFANGRIPLLAESHVEAAPC